MTPQPLFADGVAGASLANGLLRLYLVVEDRVNETGRTSRRPSAELILPLPAIGELHDLLTRVITELKQKTAAQPAVRNSGTDRQDVATATAAEGVP